MLRVGLILKAPLNKLCEIESILNLEEITSMTVEFSEREQLEWSDRFEDWSDGTEPEVEGTEHREAPLSSSTPFTCCNPILYKWKNHFFEKKGDVGMSLHEK